MTIIDENEVLQEQKKKQKIIKNIIKIVTLLILFAVILLIYVFTKDMNKCKISINFSEAKITDADFVLKDSNGKIHNENGKIYISVRKMANYLGVQYYNSEYKLKGEDKKKCYIKNENEYTSFISGSDLMYKSIEKFDKIESENGASKEPVVLDKTYYEYFKMDDMVKFENDEIYASIDAIRLGFNVDISYDSSSKILSVNTADKLFEVSKTKRADAVDFGNYEYTNKRLLKYGMCLVKNSEGNLGVGSYTNPDKIGSFVASCKYSNIVFNEATKTLSAVTSNDNKKCIIDVNLEKQEAEKTMITEHQDIDVIDNDFKYFVVSSDNKYGIINAEGKIVLPVVFEELGVKEKLFSQVDNKYIVEGKYIPVRQNGKWGLYDISGKKLIDPKFEEIGCQNSSSGEPILFIPNAKNGVTGIVFMYDKSNNYYGLYEAENGKTIAISLKEVYTKFENSEKNYFVDYVVDKQNAVVHTLNVHKDL